MAVYFFLLLLDVYRREEAVDDFDFDGNGDVAFDSSSSWSSLFEACQWKQ